VGGPPQALMDEIDKLAKGAGDDTMIGGGRDLRPTALGRRVSFPWEGNRDSDGPFTEGPRRYRADKRSFGIEIGRSKEAATSAVRFMETDTRNSGPGWEGKPGSPQIVQNTEKRLHSLPDTVSEKKEDGQCIKKKEAKVWPRRFARWSVW